ncbi:MAG: thiamine diphosphokinase [Acidimicrobiia bacterium]
MARAAVVVIGGAPPARDVVARLPADRYVIAADSGLDHALALGLHVDALVGDLDSVSAAGRHHAERSGMVIHHHPPDKDATDTELAIELATSTGCDPVIAITGGGERLDHALGALLAFASPRHAEARVELLWGEQHVHVLHGPGRLDLAGDAPDGTIVSLVPVHGDAEDVTTTGLRYPLSHETLPAGTSRGISNIRMGGTATISIGRGTILVISPTPAKPRQPSTPGRPDSPARSVEPEGH